MYLKKRVYLVVFVSFLAGILYVNLIAKDICETNELFSTYFLKQYQGMNLSTGSYFLYLCRIRILPFAVLLGIMFTKIRKAAAWLMIGWTCFLWGFLMAMAALCMGIQGNLLCLAAGMPHIFVYLIAYIVIFWYGLTYPYSHWDTQKMLFVTGTVLVGIFLEAYINPAVLKVFIGVL